MKLTEIMFNNKLMKHCLEILGHQKFALFISQYINVYPHHLLLSTYNVKVLRYKMSE